MQLHPWTSLFAGFFVLTTASLAAAQETAGAETSGATASAAATAAPGSTATPATESGDFPASGVMLQARMQSQSSLLTLVGGGAGFLVGYRASGISFGLSLGLSRVGVSLTDNTKASGTLFQLMPTVMVDVWHSRDGRARANLVGGIGYGRASLSTTGDTQSCTTPTTGPDVCTTRSSTSTAGASMLPVQLGFGGDYFLSRNFALGTEAGLQGAFLLGANTEQDSQSTSVDAGANMQFLYGLIRATMVFGN